MSRDREDASRPDQSLREQLNIIIFGTDTPAGKAFDVALLVLIVVSVLVIMLDSVESVEARYGKLLHHIELGLTALFTLEYIARLYCSEKKLRYATSFFGIVDLLSILPTYLYVVFPGARAALIIRLLRLLRVFRVLKVVRMLTEAHALMAALRASAAKIFVFISGVLIVVTIIGTLMHLIEGAEYGFDSIPRSVYWAIVTITTVGYGDIAPQTFPGQALAACLMILGYGVIAVPTGIVSSELVHGKKPRAGAGCKTCKTTRHEPDAAFCRVCGERLSQDEPPLA